MPHLLIALVAALASPGPATAQDRPRPGDVLDFGPSAPLGPMVLRGWHYSAGRPCEATNIRGCWYAHFYRGDRLLVAVAEPLSFSPDGPLLRERIVSTYVFERTSGETISADCHVDGRLAALAAWDPASTRLRLVFAEGTAFRTEERRTDGHDPNCRFDEDEFDAIG